MSKLPSSRVTSSKQPGQSYQTKNYQAKIYQAKNYQAKNYQTKILETHVRNQWLGWDLVQKLKLNVICKRCMVNQCHIYEIQSTVYYALCVKENWLGRTTCLGIWKFQFRQLKTDALKKNVILCLSASDIKCRGYEWKMKNFSILLAICFYYIYFKAVEGLGTI